MNVWIADCTVGISRPSSYSYSFWASGSYKYGIGPYCCDISDGDADTRADAFYHGKACSCDSYANNIRSVAWIADNAICYDDIYKLPHVGGVNASRVSV